VAEGRVEDVIQAYRDQVMAKERERLERAQRARVSRETAGEDLRIEAVRVCDGALQTTERVPAGGAMVVEVTYRARRRIERPVIRIGIDRMDGLICHVATTESDGSALPVLEGHGAFRLRYPALNLLPGAYRLNVTVREPGAIVPLENRRPAAFFTIVPERAGAEKESGVVRLVYDWQALASS
jgi:hypothetical protein